MITVKHPQVEKQDAQSKFLDQLPETQARFYELMFSYGNATYIYHLEATEFKPNLTDWEEWLGGLPPHIASDMKKKGFEGCKKILSFNRYINEKNDLGLDEFVCSLMGKREYEEYKKFIEE